MKNCARIGLAAKIQDLDTDILRVISSTLEEEDCLKEVEEALRFMEEIDDILPMKNIARTFFRKHRIVFSNNKANQSPNYRKLSFRSSMENHRIGSSFGIHFVEWSTTTKSCSML